MIKPFPLSLVNRNNSQRGVRYVNLRILDLQRKARLKKKNFVLDLTKILLYMKRHSVYRYNVVPGNVYAL